MRTWGWGWLLLGGNDWMMELLKYPKTGCRRTTCWNAVGQCCSVSHQSSGFFHLNRNWKWEFLLFQTLEKVESQRSIGYRYRLWICIYNPHLSFLRQGDDSMSLLTVEKWKAFSRVNTGVKRSQMEGYSPSSSNEQLQELFEINVKIDAGGNIKLKKKRC